MRTLPATLAARLAGGVTTLCRCWIVTRRDGVRLGFTDHDEDLAIGAVTCRARAGLAASEASSKLGFAVDGGEIAGALDDDALSEADLAAGLYDAAEIDIYLVDWMEPDLQVLMTRGNLGEVSREGRAFNAELRGLADRLAQESGRRYTARCLADLGDARCGVDLAQSSLRGAGGVTSLGGTSLIIASGLDGFADGWFTGGQIEWTSGANTGGAMEVKQHRIENDRVQIILWQAMSEPIAPGDTFVVTAGCDKYFSTCRDRFANGSNFRGFPHIPGNDFVMSYPVAGEPGNNGQSRQDGSAG